MQGRGLTAWKGAMIAGGPHLDAFFGVGSVREKFNVTEVLLAW